MLREQELFSKARTILRILAILANLHTLILAKQVFAPVPAQYLYPSENTLVMTSSLSGCCTRSPAAARGGTGR